MQDLLVLKFIKFLPVCKCHVAKLSHNLSFLNMRPVNAARLFFKFISDISDIYIDL